MRERAAQPFIVYKRVRGAVEESLAQSWTSCARPHRINVAHRYRRVKSLAADGRIVKVRDLTFAEARPNLILRAALRAPANN